MHEFSLAHSILEIVDESLVVNHVTKVETLILEVGMLAGVEIPALEMALESLRTGTCIEKAEIKIEIQRAEANCSNCGIKFSPTDLFSPCPSCESFAFELTSGKDFRVKSIVAE